MSLFKCSLFVFACQQQVLLVYIPPSFWMIVALKPHAPLHAIHVHELSPNTPRSRRRDFSWHQVVCQREICLHGEYPIAVVSLTFLHIDPYMFCLLSRYMGNMMVCIVLILFEGYTHFPFEVACGQEQPGNPASQTSRIVQR